MKKTLPYKVATGRLCKKAATLTGMMDIARLRRLRELLADVSGAITAELQFFIDEQKHHCLTGTLTGVLNLTCQRCMEPMQHNLSLSVAWFLVDQSQKQQDGFDEYEPVFLEEGMLSLVDSLEDELILALPLIAKHELDRCPALQWISSPGDETDMDSKMDTEVETDRPNPFSILKELQPKN